jgi:hypothetical protein
VRLPPAAVDPEKKTRHSGFWFLLLLVYPRGTQNKKNKQHGRPRRSAELNQKPATCLFFASQQVEFKNTKNFFLSPQAKKKESRCPKCFTKK